MSSCMQAYNIPTFNEYHIYSDKTVRALAFYFMDLENNNSFASTRLENAAETLNPRVFQNFSISRWNRTQLIQSTSRI